MKNPFNSIFALLILLIFVLACTISSPLQQSTPTPAPAPTAAPPPATDDENEKLKEKLEELEKKVEEQKKAPPVVTKTVPIIKNTGNFARVNSPNDGFLALRTEPSSNYGDRILQIPHGATVKILGCQGIRENVGGRTGRWCRISYQGYVGWAFDGWLVY